MEDQQVITTAGAAAEGVIFLTFNPVPPDSFTQKIQTAYSHVPLRWTMEAYDGLHILAQALDQIPLQETITAENFHAYLAQTTMYTGVSGTITFDAAGNAHRPFFVKIVKDGKLVLHTEEK